MIFKTQQISPGEAEQLCRQITADLPDYFGLPEANERYVVGVRSHQNFAAVVDDRAVGLLSLEFPYPSNANIYWVGVMGEYHRQGVGRMLLKEACLYAKARGVKTMTVETLAPQEGDENYLKTYAFYEKMGFYPLFNLKPEGYESTMVYLSKVLESPLKDLISLEIEARDYGFDWPNQDMIIDQAISECAEIREAIDLGESDQRVQEEIGDLLHTALSLCIFSGFEPDETMAIITKKFGRRLESVKTLAKQRGLTSLRGQTTEYMLGLWGEAKKLEK